MSALFLVEWRTYAKNMDSYFVLFQILAAHRYGIRRVILPERNLKDLVEVPAAVLGTLEVINF